MTTTQGFNFGISHSATPSIQDETQSRFIPSSVYSGPGPAEEFPPPTHHQQQYVPNGQRRPSEASIYAGADQRYNGMPVQQRNTTNMNLNDPVLMHLLMETAISDSKGFEIMSFEELEDLKRRRGFLRTKLDGARRQLGLEKKMQEAAHSLTKLYTEDDRITPNETKQKRSSFFSRRSGSGGGSVARAEADVDTNREKIERLTTDVRGLEEELQTVERRIVQHTAGILQYTHRGLKKNVRKNELPRSPESMMSQPRSVSNTDLTSEFDERSLYQVPDYVHEFSRSVASRNSRRITKEIQPIEDIAIRLHSLNTQLHGMIQQMPLTEHFEAPPEPSSNGLNGRVGAQIQAHLTYMSQGLEALETVKDPHMHTIPVESEQQVKALTSKLQGMLERTNSVSKSPAILQEHETGHDLQSKLEYSASVLDRLNQRVDALLEQKEILTRQIQQQRELNSKSDAQRDAHIRELTEELEETKNYQAMSDKEMQQAQDQISLLMEQLDLAKQNEQLLEKQRGLQDDSALEAERSARKENETKLMQQLEAQRNVLTQLQSDHEQAGHEFELKSQNHAQQINELLIAKEQAELDLEAAQEQLALEQKNSTTAREQALIELQQAKDQSTREIEEFRTSKEQNEAGLKKSNDQLSQDLAIVTAAREKLELELQAIKDHSARELENQAASKQQADSGLKSANDQLSKELTIVTASREKLELELQAAKEQSARDMETYTASKEQADSSLKSAHNQLVEELKDVITAREQAEQQLKSTNEALAKSQGETREIETQLVTVQTELTMAKAELDGAYGSRAQRAADASMNPEVKKQMDILAEKNASLEKQLEFLSQQHETKGVGSAELQNKVNSLQKELKDTIEDYEVMTKASIDFEKERDDFEALIDKLNEKCEKLENQINEDKVKWLGIKESLPPETTSTMVLKNEFKKMMRDSRTESMKMLRVRTIKH